MLNVFPPAAPTPSTSKNNPHLETQSPAATATASPHPATYSMDPHLPAPIPSPPKTAAAPLPTATSHAPDSQRRRRDSALQIPPHTTIASAHRPDDESQTTNTRHQTCPSRPAVAPDRARAQWPGSGSPS